MKRFGSLMAVLAFLPNPLAAEAVYFTSAAGQQGRYKLQRLVVETGEIETISSGGGTETTPLLSTSEFLYGGPGGEHYLTFMEAGELVVHRLRNSPLQHDLVVRVPTEAAVGGSLTRLNADELAFGAARINTVAQTVTIHATGNWYRVPGTETALGLVGNNLRRISLADGGQEEVASFALPAEDAYRAVFRNDIVPLAPDRFWLANSVNIMSPIGFRYRLRLYTLPVADPLEGPLISSGVLVPLPANSSLLFEHSTPSGFESQPVDRRFSGTITTVDTLTGDAETSTTIAAPLRVFATPTHAVLVYPSTQVRLDKGLIVDRHPITLLDQNLTATYDSLDVPTPNADLIYGTGPEMSQLRTLAVSRDGRHVYLISDGNRPSLKVDVATGDRTIIGHIPQMHPYVADVGPTVPRSKFTAPTITRLEEHILGQREIVPEAYANYDLNEDLTLDATDIEWRQAELVGERDIEMQD